MGVNLSYMVRARRQVLHVISSDQVGWGAFIQGPTGLDKLRWRVSPFGSFLTAEQLDPLNPDEKVSQIVGPSELLAGVTWLAAPEWTVNVSAGPGIGKSAGTPSLRTLLQLAYTAAPVPKDPDGDGLVEPVDQCPLQPEDLDEFQDNDGCPDPDNDADGLDDVEDKCPVSPEDKDGFEDEDGCPEGDNDQDEIEDEQDRCPVVPEDLDGYEDEDGCPDLDNDGDGILDVSDSCPDQGEDVDGFMDDDGCPEPDNDQDSILDPDDTCPNDPANKCKAARVNGEIAIYDKIRFARSCAKIRRKSYKTLDAVAQILSENPDVTRVEVQGHTDSDGGAARNLKLSEGRARAVVEYLVKKGIAAERLTPRGYGEERPLVPNTSRKNKATNRRVQFVIDSSAVREK